MWTWSEMIDDNVFGHIPYEEVIIENIMQYTWLQDSQWTPIYEGDILTCGLINEVLGEVKFWECWINMGEYTTYGFYVNNEYLELLTPTSIYYKVIWNIYEHPHLLDENK